MAVIPSTTVDVEESAGGRYTQQMRAGSHVLTADEPVTSGGNDEGPNPYEYLLMALGACTNMTLRMYAEHKGLALSHVHVRLTHQKLHAKDCADCESNTGKFDEIEREIFLEGDLTTEQRSRMLEIANRCPVHRSLTSEIKVRTKLSDKG